MSLIIAIDCDDVLIASTEYLVEAYNEAYGTNVTLARAHEPRNEEWGTVDRKLILDRLARLQQTERYGSLAPSQEAVGAIRTLAEKHELHLITARSQAVEKVTQLMIDAHLRGCFTTIEHIGHDKSKGEVCRRLNADILIDDNMRHLLSALEYGMKPGNALHFGAYAWNELKESLPTGVVQCDNWTEVMTEVDAIAGH